VVGLITGGEDDRSNHRDSGVAERLASRDWQSSSASAWTTGWSEMAKQEQLFDLRRAETDMVGDLQQVLDIPLHGHVPAGIAPIRLAFIRGYRDGGGNSEWEEHFVNVVIPCESKWDVNVVNSMSGAKGIAQFIDSTWAAAGGGDWRDPYQQGRNVASWSSMVDPSGAGGWQERWRG